MMPTYVVISHRDIAHVPAHGWQRPCTSAPRNHFDTLRQADVKVLKVVLTTVYSISSKRDVQTLFTVQATDSADLRKRYSRNRCAVWHHRSGSVGPDDISIVGIGDFKGSSEIEPALTTIRLPARQIGHDAGPRWSMLLTLDAALSPANT